MTGTGAPSLLCVGNVTIDEAVQPDGTRSLMPGGDALYAALAARALIEDVRWLAPIGSDMPESLLAELAAAGIVAADPTRRVAPCVRNVVTYAADGSRRWELVHGEAHFDDMSVHPGDPTDAMLAVDGVLVCGMSRGAQLALVPWLRRRTSARVYLDLQEDAIAGYEAEWRAALGCADVFLPSEVEAVALAGTDDLERALRDFRELGPTTIVIKRAERGCLVLDDRGVAIEVPAPSVTPRDSTGAGDSFCGAFAAAHLAGRSAEGAAVAATALAAVAIGDVGLRGLLRHARTAWAREPVA